VAEPEARELACLLLPGRPAEALVVQSDAPARLQKASQAPQVRRSERSASVRAGLAEPPASQVVLELDGLQSGA